jgi:hypothetical protein
MNTTLLKAFTVALILVGCVFVWVFGSPTSEKVFARSSSIAVTHRLPPDGKEMPKDLVTLNKDSTTEHGEVIFDHNAHVSNKYSPDGTTDISCAECHHTDQPKSALKPPLITSFREVTLSVEELKKADSAIVKGCRTCHFQKENIPEGKTIPVAVYTTADGKEDKKEITNEVAFHTNCNSCHDAAVKLRPKLKKKPGFATTKDCMVCHAKN